MTWAQVVRWAPSHYWQVVAELRVRTPEPRAPPHCRIGGGRPDLHWASSDAPLAGSGKSVSFLLLTRLLSQHEAGLASLLLVTVRVPALHKASSHNTWLGGAFASARGGGCDPMATTWSLLASGQGPLQAGGDPRPSLAPPGWDLCRHARAHPFPSHGLGPESVALSPRMRQREGAGPSPLCLPRAWGPGQAAFCSLPFRLLILVSGMGF